MKELFYKYQPQLLKLANHPLGRKYLGISHEVKDKIVVKLDPNAYTTQVGRRKFQSTFRCYNLFEKKLGGALKFSDSLLEGIKYYFTPQEFRWLEYCASPETFYSGAGDGSVSYNGDAGAGTAWATGHDAVTGSSMRDDEDPAYGPMITIRNDNGLLGGIGRWFSPHNTTSLTLSATLVSAVYSYMAQYFGDYWSTDAKSRLDLVQSTQADPITLALADFDQLGTTLGASSIDLTGLSTETYINFTLNATGLTWISKTGWTLLGSREGHDTDNTSPAQPAGETRYTGIYPYTSEEAGTTSDPKLVVTFSLPTADENSGFYLI